MSAPQKFQQGRYLNVSLVRLVLTLMVFFFHVRYIYFLDDWEEFFPLSGALQGFNFLSAFLYSSRELGSNPKFFKRNLPKLLVPGLVAFLLIVLFDMVVFLIRGAFSWDAFLAALSLYTPRGYFTLSFGNLYYCLVIAVLYLTIPFLYYSLKHPWLKYLLIALAVLEFFPPYFWGETIFFAPFLFGFYYGRKYYANDIGISPQKAPRFSAFFALILLFLGLVINDAVRLHGSPFGPLIARSLSELGKTIVGVALVIFLLRAFHNLKNEKLASFFVWSDRLSYPFFLSHFTFFVGGLAIQQYLPGLVLPVAVTFLCSALMACLVYFLSKPLIRQLAGETPALPLSSRS